MSAVKFALPLLLLTSFFCGESQAQSPSPLYHVTYQVQVKYEMWRSGLTYWATEFETTDINDAKEMHGLYKLALDEGMLDDIMGSGPEWVPVDVRLRTHYEVLLQPIKTTVPKRNYTIRR